METELFPKVISGTGMSSLAASLSQSEEEQMGSFVDVTVHPAIAIEREEGVVVSS
jgi:DNA helicase HerA-like ATPase